MLSDDCGVRIPLLLECKVSAGCDDSGVRTPLLSEVELAVVEWMDGEVSGRDWHSRSGMVSRSIGMKDSGSVGRGVVQTKPGGMDTSGPMSRSSWSAVVCFFTM